MMIRAVIFDVYGTLLTVGPPLFMMTVILVLGIWPPEFLVVLLMDGAAMLGVHP